MKKSVIFFFLAFLFSSSISYGQTEKLKTVFIYNFTKYIRWPDEVKTGDFIIGVVGKSNLTKELEELSKVKKVGNQPIVIKYLNSPGEGSGSHILLITEEASSELDVARSVTQGKPTLIVTEKEGLASRGAGINFLIDGGKLLFEINRTNIEAHSLMVSSQLISLGKQVQ